MDLTSVFVLTLVVQFFHSLEELIHRFYEVFPAFKMTFRFFLSFEIIFLIFWISVALIPGFPFRIELMAFFVLLMFVNGIWHLVWSGIERRYRPGLYTAPFFIVIFIVFYFKQILQ